MTYSIFELNKFIESQSLNVPASVHLFSRSEVNEWNYLSENSH